jgi:hypothetical protein
MVVGGVVPWEARTAFELEISSDTDCAEQIMQGQGDALFLRSEVEGAGTDTRKPPRRAAFSIPEVM